MVFCQPLGIAFSFFAEFRESVDTLDEPIDLCDKNNKDS